MQQRLGPAHTAGAVPAGHYTARTAGDALGAILADARRGTLQAHEATGATFADAAAEYLRYIADVRMRERSTVTDYASVINGYLLAEFGHMSLEAITADHIDAYKERLLAEGRLGNRTVVRHLTVLHGIFRRAGRVWGLARNPASADLVERLPVRYSGEFKTLRPDEVLQLARIADGRQDAALYITAAFSGLRLGELLALRWHDVDFALQRLHVRRNYTDRREKAPKSGRVRSAPMVDEVTAALDGLTRLARTSPPRMTSCSPTRPAGISAGGRCAAATTPRSTRPACLASGSTICAIVSPQSLSSGSRFTPSRATSDTRTSAPRCATSTTRLRPATWRSSPRRSGPRQC